MSIELKELRKQIAKHRRQNSRRKLPSKLRQQTLTYVQSRLDQDETLTNIAREIGVSYTYAKGLLYENSEAEVEPECTTLMPVQITPDIEQGAHGSALEVVSPAGYRLQGLSLQQALEAMRVLS